MLFRGFYLRRILGFISTMTLSLAVLLLKFAAIVVDDTCCSCCSSWAKIAPINTLEEAFALTETEKF